MATWIRSPKQAPLRKTSATFASLGWQEDITLVLYRGKSLVYRGLNSEGKLARMTNLANGLTDLMSVDMIPTLVNSGKVVVRDYCDHCGADVWAHHDENEHAFSCDIAENYLADAAERALPA